MKRHFIFSIILLVLTSLCYAEKNVKVTGIVFQAWGALHFYLAGRTLKEDYERASSH